MQFKIGEKVCFLNERRDGIVTKIINSKMVSVAIEEGFEIPVLISELAPIVMPDYIQDKKEYNLQREPSVVNQYEVLEANEQISSIFISPDRSQDKGIYIAYVPEKDSNLLSANLSVFLINNTSYDLLFSYYLKSENKYFGTDYDRLDTESKYLLQNIDKSQLGEWTDIRFQILFFKKESSTIKPPLDKEIRIKPIKFYKEENYKYSPFIEQRCIMVAVTGHLSTETEEPEVVEKSDYPAEKENVDISEKEVLSPFDKKGDRFPEKHMIDRKVAEVDLHIDELLDSIEGMTNNELLMYQVNYFTRMLESAISNKFLKITFIHGVGNGKLKAEIRKTLKESYPFLKVYDASMAKYGVGATEVQIPVNTSNLQSKQK